MNTAPNIETSKNVGAMTGGEFGSGLIGGPLNGVNVQCNEDGIVLDTGTLVAPNPSVTPGLDGTRCKMVMSKDGIDFYTGDLQYSSPTDEGFRLNGQPVGGGGGGIPTASFSIPGPIVGWNYNSEVMETIAGGVQTVFGTAGTGAGHYSILANNLYSDGTFIRYKNDGPGSIIIMFGGETMIETAPVGVKDAVATLAPQCIFYPTYSYNAGPLHVGDFINCDGYLQAARGSLPAGGDVSQYISVAGIGIFAGSGAPTVAAAQGSIYLRSDGTSSDRLYVNSDGATTWDPLSSGDPTIVPPTSFSPAFYTLGGAPFAGTYDWTTLQAQYTCVGKLTYFTVMVAITTIFPLPGVKMNLPLPRAGAAGSLDVLLSGSTVAVDAFGVSKCGSLTPDGSTTTYASINIPDAASVQGLLTINGTYYAA